MILLEITNKNDDNINWWIKFKVMSNFKWK